MSVLSPLHGDRRLSARLSLWHRATVGLIALVALTGVAIGFYSYTQNANVIKRDRGTVGSANKLIEAAGSQQDSAKNYLLAPSSRKQAVFSDQRRKFKSRVAAASKSWPTTPADASFIAIKRYQSRLDNQLRAAVRAGGGKPLVSAEQLRRSLVAALAKQRELALASIALHSEQSDQKLTALAGGTLVLIFLIVAMTWLLLKRSMRRLNMSVAAVTQGLRNLAAGQMANRVDPDQMDPQFIEIAAALNAMSGNLSTTREHNVRAIDQLRNDSLNDHLTGLPNRRYFDDQLEREIARSRRYRNSSPFSIVEIDIDLFKQINDQYGHDIGDQVLRAFGELVRSSLREEDFAARIGGEEFAIIYPETPLDGAKLATERLRNAFSELQINGLPPELRVTLSAGVAPLEPEITAADLLKLADTMLYKAKHSGRNRVCMPELLVQF